LCRRTANLVFSLLSVLVKELHFVMQAVLSSPFTNSSADSNGDTTFTYIPASSVGAAGDSDTVVTSLNAPAGM